MLKVDLKCPYCGAIIIFSGSDFESNVVCKCGAFGEAWFFPHRLRGLRGEARLKWSIGDHYPNDILATCDKWKFLANFIDFVVKESDLPKIKELYCESVIKKYGNDFMGKYVDANYPFLSTAQETEAKK